jgi:hypothetical protein
LFSNICILLSVFPSFFKIYILSLCLLIALFIYISVYKYLFVCHVLFSNSGCDWVLSLRHHGSEVQETCATIATETCATIATGGLPSYYYKKMKTVVYDSETCSMLVFKRKSLKNVKSETVSQK